MCTYTRHSYASLPIKLFLINQSNRRLSWIVIELCLLSNCGTRRAPPPPPPFYLSVQAHISEDFWKLVIKHTVEGEGTVNFLWSRHRLFDEGLTQALLDRCLAAASPRATVTRVTARDSHRKRPVGLNTTELQKIASRKFRMDPQKCLQVAESLYNKQILSYPRTENDTYVVPPPPPPPPPYSLSAHSFFSTLPCEHR
jgi:hypothetical protein